MKKALKITLVVIFCLFLLLLILPFAFKGKIKERVINEANKSLTATLSVGEVKVSLIRSFPNAYVGLQDVTIIGQDRFQDDTLLHVKKLSVSTGIMDLLNGSPYRLRKIVIDRADVRLKVLDDGQANWDIARPAEMTEPDPSAEEPGNFRLVLHSLVIRDSRLVYDDAPNVTYVILEGLNHQLSGDLTEDFTTLKTYTESAKALVNYDGITYLANAFLKWKADLDADLAGNVYTFRDNQLLINDFELKFEGKAGLPEEGYDLDLAFSSPNSTFRQLLSLVPAVYSRDFAEIQTDGTVSFDGFVKGLYTGELYPSFGINLRVADAWFRYPGLPDAVKDIQVQASVVNAGGDPDNTVVHAEKISLSLAGTPVRASLLLRNPMTDPYIDTRVDLKLDLADVGKYYPLEEGEALSGRLLADFMLKGRLSDVEAGRYQAFEAAGNIIAEGLNYTAPYFSMPVMIGKARLNITPAFLEMPEFKASAGNSDFSLNGKMENYLGHYLQGETLKGNFNFNSNVLDVNELLTFQEEGADGAAASDEPLTAFIVPAGIDFTLNATAGSINYMDFDIRDFKGKVIVRDQRLALENAGMRMLGGTVRASGFYETADPANPLVDLSLGLDKINIPETFRQIVMVERFAPIAEKVFGDFSGNFKLAGLLDSHMMPRLETLNGLAGLVTSTLEIKNVNTLNALSDNLKLDQFRELKMNGISMVVQFLDGVMDVKPFDFIALGIDMNLSGQTSLDQRIGYVLKMNIPRSMMGGAANNVLNDLVSKAGQAGFNIQPGDFVNVDALIEGTITDPKVRLNLAGTAQSMAGSLKEQVKEQVEQKVEEVKEQVKEEAGKYLQEAEQRAKSILDEAQRQSDELMANAQKLADETKKQANAQADNIIREAKGKGAVAELAAKKSADEVRKQGDKQAQNILNEARNKSNALLDKARLEADKVVEEAKEKVE